MAAVAPLTPSRFGNSTHLPQNAFNSEVRSMAETLPSIDFGFGELRERMAAFTVRFDDFIAQGRKRVLAQRNEFRMSTAELQESQRSRRQAIQDLETKASAHAQTIEKEVQETDELQAAIGSLQKQKEDQLRRRTDLEAEVQALHTDVKQHKDAQLAHHRALEAQARHDIPELRTWEELLGLRIEGAEAGTEQLRFIFTDVDKRNKDLEAWFEMDFANRDMRIVQTRPLVPQEDVADLEARLGDSRDIGTLLKGMRTLFVEALKT